MKTTKSTRATKALEKALISPPKDKYVMRLFVAGATEKSRQAILRARHLCEAEFPGAFKLEVIDIYQQPALARDGQIIATPTLVREFPRPVRRLIGNLSNFAGLVAGLELDTKGRTVN